MSGGGVESGVTYKQRMDFAPQVTPSQRQDWTGMAVAALTVTLAIVLILGALEIVSPFLCALGAAVLSLAI